MARYASLFVAMAMIAAPSLASTAPARPAAMVAPAPDGVQQAPVAAKPKRQPSA
jgi:hypothetical protein